MAQYASLVEQESSVVHTRPVLDMDDDQFFRFCRINRDLRLERTAEGDIIIMAPEPRSRGLGTSKLTKMFGTWAGGEGTGQGFGSYTGFTQAPGSMRSPK